MHPKTKRILNNLQLKSVFTGVFAKATDSLFQKLLKVQPYVTYGYVETINPLSIFPCYSISMLFLYSLMS